MPYYDPPECQIYSSLGKRVNELRLVEQGRFLSIVQTDAETMGLVPCYVREGGGLRDLLSQKFFYIDLSGQFAGCRLVGSDLLGLPVR
jgi:hypothetical protein